MALAEVVQEAQRPQSQVYTAGSRESLSGAFSSLQKEVESKLHAQGIAKNQIRYELFLNMRYKGTETAMMILETSESDFRTGFLKRHMQEYNFVFPEDRAILIDDVRVRGIGVSEGTSSDSSQLSHDLRNLTFRQISREESGIVSTTLDSP